MVAVGEAGVSRAGAAAAADAAIGTRRSSGSSPSAGSGRTGGAVGSGAQQTRKQNEKKSGIESNLATAIAANIVLKEKDFLGDYLR